MRERYISSKKSLFSCSQCSYTWTTFMCYKWGLVIKDEDAPCLMDLKCVLYEPPTIFLPKNNFLPPFLIMMIMIMKKKSFGKLKTCRLNYPWSEKRTWTIFFISHIAAREKNKVSSHIMKQLSNIHSECAQQSKIYEEAYQHLHS